MPGKLLKCDSELTTFALILSEERAAGVTPIMKKQLTAKDASEIGCQSEGLKPSPTAGG